MRTAYENKMRKPPKNKAASPKTECHCIVCDPNFSTRGVTHFIDSHHITADGSVFFIGDNAEKGTDGKWKFKDPSIYE